MKKKRKAADASNARGGLSKIAKRAAQAGVPRTLTYEQEPQPGTSRPVREVVYLGTNIENE